MPEARRLWAAHKLLDRQIVDREGLLAGNVDDVVLEPDGDRIVVTAIRSGPGAVAYRLGAKRLGSWLQRLHVELEDLDGMIPFSSVASVGNHVAVAKDADELASERTEVWFRKHVINHIPGNRDVAE